MYLSCNFGRMLSVGAIHFEDLDSGRWAGTWRLSRLVVENPWSALARPFLSQTGVETAPLVL